MKAPEMARKIRAVLDSLDEVVEAEVRVSEDASGPEAVALELVVSAMRARIVAERQLLELHASSHVCADLGLPWLATPYDVDGDDGEPCWTLRWLARAHQVIGFPEWAAGTVLAGDDSREPGVELEALFGDGV